MATLAELWDSNQSTKDFTQFPQSRGVTDTHKGIDYKTPLNTPIAANISGTIRYKTNDPKGYGNAVEIVDEKGNVLQRYAHLNEFSVPNGSKIEAGQILGKSGNTGRSTGPHLHFEDFQSKYANKQTGETLADLWDKTPTTEVKQPQVEAPRNETPLSKVNAVQNLGQKLIGNVTGVTPDTAEFVAKDLAAKFDNTVGSVLPFFTKKISQAGTRFLGADKAAEISDKLTSYVDKPVGKAFGITNDPVYQNEALGKIMNFIGENKDKGDQWIANKTGINKNDVAFFSDLALIKAGEVGAKATGKAATQIGQQFEEAKKEFPVAEMKKPQGKSSVTLQPLESTLSGVGAAKSEINPYKGFTGEDTISKGEFPSVKLSRIGKDVTKPEQAKIADVVKEIMGSESGIRPGVITRNENTLRNEYGEAKLPNPTPKGELLKQQIVNEQNALYNYAAKRIENTGANKNLVTDYERGQVFHDAVASEEGLLGHFKQEKEKIYQEAKDQVGDNPIQTSHVDTLLNNPQFKSGLKLKNHEGVAKGAEELINLAKEVGFTDEFNVTHPPGSISAYDAVRKAINNGWSPDNAKTIARINRAIDEDIASAGGGELYKKADQLHAAEKTLFESKGMKELFKDLDPNGIQKGIPFEQMITKLNSMPIDQWKHVFDTLSLLENGLVKTKKFEMQVPSNIQDFAKAAKAEMLGGLAREVYQKGAKNQGEWNKNEVHTILNARAEKIKHGFSPEEQKAFHTLNYGGHFLQPRHEYEGGGLQSRRVGLIEKNAPALGEAVGATIGTAVAPGVGTAIGSYLGRKQGESTQGKMSSKKAEKERAKLEEEMQKNTKLSDIGKK